MENGIILSQTDVKKILINVLNIKEEQVVQSKYSFIIKGVSEEKIQSLLEKRR